jgi:Zn-dependent protease
MPSIRLIRLAGVTVRLDAGWAVVAAFLAWSLASGRFPSLLPPGAAAAYWTGGLVAVVLLLASIALHELAHGLVRHAFGMRVSAVTLHVFGASSRGDADPPPHPLADAVVAAVGPLTSFAVATVALITRHAAAEADWPAALLGYIGLVNVSVALFNLIPGFPLDGGRLLRALLWWWGGAAPAATVVAIRLGVLFAIALTALGVCRLSVRDVAGGIWFIALGAFLFDAARSSAAARRSARPVETARTLDRVA